MPYLPYCRFFRAHLVAAVLAFSTIVLPAGLLADEPAVATPGAAAATGTPDKDDVGKPAVPAGLEDVGVDEHLDGPLPMDAVFRDQNGKTVRFGDLFDGKRPFVLTLAYHTCPTVCSLVLSQTVESLKNVPWSVGKEFNAITLSFDPRETLERSVAKRDELLKQYGRPGADAGWTFLIGDDVNIHRITDAVGFHYHYVEREQQFAHPTVVVILKPNGEVARYLYGLQYSPKDVRLGLLEASNGRSITTIDKVILYCYHYDPNGGRYVLMGTRVMQVGAGVCGLGLIAFLASFWLKELVAGRRKRASHTNPPNGAGSMFGPLP